MMTNEGIDQAERLDLITDIVQQILPDSSQAVVARVHEGISTRVYRIRNRDEVLYLRVLPELNASFAPETRVHTIARERGVHAPAIVYFEAHNPIIGRSLMVISEIRGQSLDQGERPPLLHEILFDAGKELAIVNSIHVDGFGWIRRDQGAPTHLCAEHPTYTAWMSDQVDGALARLEQTHLLAPTEIEAIRVQAAEANRLFGETSGRLAHGDFDLSHIYHADGVYTGMIDFGEIRGANAFYDLGHFQIDYRDLLPYLLEGYAEIAPLPPDYERQIHLCTLLDALHWVSRRLATQRPIYPPTLDAVRWVLDILDG